MDFIERWFGVSPDGGDGTLELLYMAVGVVVVAAFVGRRWLIRRSRPAEPRAAGTKN